MVDAAVIVYVQPECIACRVQISYLNRLGVAFTLRDVRDDPAACAELLALGSNTTPTTVVDGVVLIGLDPRRLRALLGL